ncbi:MAG: hypothetical protein Q7T36_10830 [Fluviicoccus sp.]|uniref:transporter substrate-binding domain-containing protein n=1 Tax=Fluviicoccus sp. TaxID=2003552 RepID=UPI0027202F2A|nr:transporter substrate-binding domain-containing protein [Fluviicoccus sp.]MDO8330950.1 hypothetical protein [Fluviicoccus sp.]
MLKAYVELMNLAAEKAGHTLSAVPMNWEDCQEMVKQGQFDGAMPAIWNDKRAEFLHMPADAGTNLDTPFALAKLDYALITPVGSSYEYNGVITSVPQPILVPEGYVLAKEIAKLDPSLKITSIGADDYDNFVRLTRGEPGSVIALKQYAKKVLKKPQFRKTLKLSKKTVFAKTFFMAFSKKSVSADEVMKMWKNIPVIKKSPAWEKIQARAASASGSAPAVKPAPSPVPVAPQQPTPPAAT